MKSVKVFDNLGATIDRYTVVIDNDVYLMSHNPLSPQGINQYMGIADAFDLKDNSLGNQVAYKELPEDVVEAIILKEA